MLIKCFIQNLAPISHQLKRYFTVIKDFLVKLFACKKVCVNLVKSRGLYLIPQLHSWNKAKKPGEVEKLSRHKRNHYRKLIIIIKTQKEEFHLGKVSERSDQRREYNLTPRPPRTYTSTYFFHRTFLKARLITEIESTSSLLYLAKVFHNELKEQIPSYPF